MIVRMLVRIPEIKNLIAEAVGSRPQSIKDPKIWPDLALRPSNVFEAIWKSASSGESSIDDLRRLEFDEFNPDRSGPFPPAAAAAAAAELISHGRTMAWWWPPAWFSWCSFAAKEAALCDKISSMEKLWTPFRRFWLCGPPESLSSWARRRPCWRWPPTPTPPPPGGNWIGIGLKMTCFGGFNSAVRNRSKISSPRLEVVVVVKSIGRSSSSSGSSSSSVSSSSLPSACSSSSLLSLSRSWSWSRLVRKIRRELRLDFLPPTASSSSSSSWSSLSNRSEIKLFKNKFWQNYCAMAKLKKPPGTSVDYYSIVFLTSKLLRFMTLET